MIRQIYSQIFFCKRTIQKLCGCDAVREHHINRISVVDRPWLWIGGYDQSSKSIIDITEEINEIACYGDLINSDFLNMISGEYDVEHWKYIDAKTLEEKNFPPEGFIIYKDDSDSD